MISVDRLLSGRKILVRTVADAKGITKLDFVRVRVQFRDPCRCCEGSTVRLCLFGGHDEMIYGRCL